MKFGPIPIAEAVGAVAAHTVRAGEAIVRKGATIGEDDARKLAAAGLSEIVAVQLEVAPAGREQKRIAQPAGKTSNQSEHVTVDLSASGRLLWRRPMLDDVGKPVLQRYQPS